jgi:hypothetical protein
VEIPAVALTFVFLLSFRSAAEESAVVLPLPLQLPLPLLFAFAFAFAF